MLSSQRFYRVLPAVRNVSTTSNVCARTIKYTYKPILWKRYPPHPERAKMLEISRPMFPELDTLHPGDTCPKREAEKPQFSTVAILEGLFAKKVEGELEGSKFILFCHANPTKGKEVNMLKLQFLKIGIQTLRYNNNILKRALRGAGMEAATHFTQGAVYQNVILICPEIKVKEALRILKKTQKLIPMAGVIHNRLLSHEELEAYSALPEKTTLLAQFCATLDSAASSLTRTLGQQQMALSQTLETLSKSDASNDKNEK